MPSRTILFGVYTLSLIAATEGVLRDLIAFSFANQTASHVVLVPFVTAVLIYQSRRSIFAVVEPAVRVGIAVGLVGLALLLGSAHPALHLHPDVLTVKVAGVTTLWVGGFLAAYGLPAARAALFPLLFLGFAIPLPGPIIDGATQVLKAGSTEMVAGLFTLTRTPYLREGFVFSLPGFVIEVADECSGIRSSIALVLTALLAGHVLLEKPWAKALVVALIVPITILKNGIRIVSLSLLAINVDPGFLTGQLHHEGGIVFFVLALAMLAPVVAALRWREASGLETATSSTNA